MKKVFVSGCYDILHAGHIQFFRNAKKLGDHLTVCFASDEVLALAKKRKPSIPEDNKMILIGAVDAVDEVVTSSDLDPVFDFVSHLPRIKPDIIAVTEDDRNAERKKEFCEKHGIEFVILPKDNPVTQVSTTSILRNISGRVTAPLRVDFAGGWLDVPKFAKEGGFIVNCAISPLVSGDDWQYEKGGGLGGSAAHAILAVKSGLKSELDLGVGWQDPAVITETGLCVWRSGEMPVLHAKYNPDWLIGKMLIYWTGESHNTPGLVDMERDFDSIFEAGNLAKEAVHNSDIEKLAEAINLSYKVQLGEGMKELPNIENAIAQKYLGGGHGGYALYVFSDTKDREKALSVEGTKAIEPYVEPII